MENAITFWLLWDCRDLDAEFCLFLLRSVMVWNHDPRECSVVFLGNGVCLGFYSGIVPDLFHLPVHSYIHQSDLWALLFLSFFFSLFICKQRYSQDLMGLWERAVSESAGGDSELA